MLDGDALVDLEGNCEHRRSDMIAWHSSAKDQVGNGAGCVGHKASVTALGLCHRRHVHSGVPLSQSRPRWQTTCSTVVRNEAGHSHNTVTCVCIEL